MSNDKIHRLVERFMQGATTDSEEQELYRAFRSGDVPDDLKHLTDMFIGLDLVRQPIPAAPTRASRIVWWKIASAAAAVALIIFGAWMLFGTQTPSDTPQPVVAKKKQEQPVTQLAKAEEQPAQPTKAEERPAPQAIAKAKPRKAAKRQSTVVEPTSEQATADDAPTLTPEEKYRLEQQRMIASCSHSTDYDTMLQDIRQRGDQIMETAFAVCSTN